MHISSPLLSLKNILTFKHKKYFDIITKEVPNLL